MVTPDEIKWYDMPQTPDQRTEVWAIRYRINQKLSSAQINHWILLTATAPMANHRSKISTWVPFVYKNTNRICHEGSEAALSPASSKLVLSADPAVSNTIRNVWRGESRGNTSCLSCTHLRGNRYHKQHMVDIKLIYPLALSLGARWKKSSAIWIQLHLHC